MIYPYVYIVIVVHNRVKYTRGCLEALSVQTFKNFKIVIVDDGSTDGTTEMIRGQYPNVILLRGDGNLWWAGGTNLGVKYALENDAKYVITLNDDTLPNPDFVAKMVEAAEKNPNSLIGAAAFDVETKRLIYGGERINWLTAKYVSLLEVLTESQRHGLHEVTHFPGRGLIVPVLAYRTVGLYDSEKLPQVMADYDFTIRCKRFGYTILCDFDVTIGSYVHESGDNKIRKEKSLKNYYEHLFGIKGGGNLKFFCHFSVKNCPRKYIWVYLPVGISRRIWGYLFEWVKELLNKNITFNIYKA